MKLRHFLLLWLKESAVKEKPLSGGEACASFGGAPYFFYAILSVYKYLL